MDCISPWGTTLFLLWFYFRVGWCVTDSGWKTMYNVEVVCDNSQWPSESWKNWMENSSLSMVERQCVRITAVKTKVHPALSRQASQCPWTLVSPSLKWLKYTLFLLYRVVVWLKKRKPFKTGQILSSRRDWSAAGIITPIRWPKCQKWACYDPVLCLRQLEFQNIFDPPSSWGILRPLFPCEVGMNAVLRNEAFQLFCMFEIFHNKTLKD